MPGSPDIVTRFAPSPTGHLHIGGARTALFCWAFARRSGGRFMIRIEDTDQARSSEESARGILEDLAWLGIEWDDGPTLQAGGRRIGGDERGVAPYFQAQRVHYYNLYIEQLVRAGRAYPAFETTEELEAKRQAAVAAKQTYRYERPADVRLGEFNEARWNRAQAGERHVIRFFALREEILVADQVLGDVRIRAGELDDFVIRKADGFPTYHFAVVVDDELMGVTHVLRAQEHLANTPRHVAMQKALRRHDTGAPFRTPVYGHMPLICNMDGSKMSKRDKAKAARKAAKDTLAKNSAMSAESLAKDAGLDAAHLAQFLAAENDDLAVAEALARRLSVVLPEIEVWDFRQNGYLPEAITNFVALLGWNPGMKTADGKDLEKFDNAFIAANFSIDRIGKTNSKFDRAKLLSFNADAIAGMTDAQFARRWSDWLREYEPGVYAAVASWGPPDNPRLLALAAALRPRARTLRDALRPAAFAFVTDTGYAFDSGAVEKHLKAGQGIALLREISTKLQAQQEWTAAGLNLLLEAFTKEKALPNMGAVAQPLRVALTGTGVSPGLGETMVVLGKTSTLARISRCLETHGS